MTAADGILAVIAAAAVAYTVLGGADFGGGVWDLLAGRARRSDQRGLIATAMGPVWEANHVWLVFVLIGGFSGFPVAFGRLSRLLAVPLAIALLGIVARGAAFVFRQYGSDGPGPAVRGTLAWGRVFAIASAGTPMLLGLCVGAIATGRLGGLFPTYAGLTALGFCAYLAAVFLCQEATARQDTDLAERFRRRALVAGSVAGGLALAGPAVLAVDAPALAGRLAGPVLLVSVVAGAGSLVLVRRRRFRPARVVAAVAVAAVVAGAVRAMYPVLVPPDLTVAAAAAPSDTLPVTLAILVAGFAVTVPSLVLLMRTFQPRLDPPQ